MNNKNIMLEKEVKKNELPYFVNIQDYSSLTDGLIFKKCREFQDEALIKNVKITNLSSIYFWIKEERENKKIAKKKTIKKKTTKNRKEEKLFNKS